MNKKIISFFVILIIFFTGIFYLSLKKEKRNFNLVEVSRGTISQFVSETGRVERGEEIRLAFKNSGEIEKIFVKKGDEVKAGQILAKLETTDLTLQLEKAKAALESAQAQLNKLLAGVSPEEIQVAKTSVSNAKTFLKNAKQNLKDIQLQAKENLNKAYEDALNILKDSYLKFYNAFLVVDSIQRNYFFLNNQEGIEVREGKEKMKEAMEKAKEKLDLAEENSEPKNIELALSEMKEGLEISAETLGFVRQLCEEFFYRGKISAKEKEELDIQRAYINEVLTAVIKAQQSISLTKINNQAKLNAAKARVSEAEGQLQTAKAKLDQLLAPARKEDINFYRAKIKEAKAQIRFLENQIKECTLKSEIPGQVTKINLKEGEIFQPLVHQFVIGLLPKEPFQIKVDIYEEDIPKIKIGNLVEISLVAFPNQIFKGKVISIDLTEKIIEGVVYYQVTIGFEGEIPKGIKPGMTADLKIITARKENVLLIPEEAIERENGKDIVKVFKKGKIEKREIEAGLISEGKVEVISGLREGEKIVI